MTFNKEVDNTAYQFPKQNMTFHGGISIELFQENISHDC